MTWRRICFYSHGRFDMAKPIVSENPNTNNDYLRRNLAEFLPGVGRADEVTGEFLWQGTSGVDYTEDTRMYGRLDPQRVRVVSDRKMDLNPNYEMFDPADPGGTLGKHVSRKLWHPVNRNMTYEQDESGGDKDVPAATSGWTTTRPGTDGNYYILDIFHTGRGDTLPDPDTVVCGQFNLQSTVYWHER